MSSSVQALVSPEGIKPAESGRELRSIMPAAQWPRVVHLLVDQVDALEPEAPEDACCDDCRARFSYCACAQSTRSPVPQPDVLACLKGE